MQAPMTIKQYVSQMRKIPGGRFTMGRTYSVDKQLTAFRNELPAHPVHVDTYNLGVTPVTVGMWREYVLENKNITMPEVPAWDWIDDHPMVNLAWNDIVGRDGRSGYCSWASRISGVQLCLPTEAQWEFAAKGGGTDLMFPWGESWDRAKLWCGLNGERTSAVIRVNNIYTNRYGISDMVGNVWEWCFDGFFDYSVPKRDRLGYLISLVNPRPVGSGLYPHTERVIRGGGWQQINPEQFRCNIRVPLHRGLRSFDLGFRLAASA